MRQRSEAGGDGDGARCALSKTDRRALRRITKQGRFRRERERDRPSKDGSRWLGNWHTVDALGSGGGDARKQFRAEEVRQTEAADLKTETATG